MKFRSIPYSARHLLFGAIVLGAAYSYHAHAATNQPPIPHGVAMKSWQENGRDGRYLLQFLNGTAPKAGATIAGIVKTDTDCDIDAAGLSHCHNIIEMANGTLMTVIDTHNMHRYRCLGTGDRLSLTALGGPWIVGVLQPK